MIYQWNAGNRDHVGAQNGAGCRQGRVGRIPRAAQHEGGIAVPGVPREGDDLEEVGFRGHQAFSGL